jgi:pimeloyl-ACP methyl ester carboxylesterase
MSLHFVKVGSAGKHPMVWLHGMLGRGAVFSQLVEAFPFATHYLPDLRNHGDSFHHSDMRYEVLVDDVASLIKANGLQGCTLLGHSLGGSTTSTLAANMPDLISSAVIMDSPLFDTENETRSFVRNCLKIAVELNVETLTYADAKDQLEKKIGVPNVAFAFTSNLKDDNGNAAWICNMKVIADHFP